MTATEMTGGEAVVAALEALGVTHVFGIVSVHNLPIYDAIDRSKKVTSVNVRHEAGATHAADGYSRTTGKLGVCLTSTGPGACNAMTGLFEAGFASSRVMMITGQIESRYYGKGKGFLHEAERQMQMLRSITRRAESVQRTEDVARTVVDLARDICTGRPQPGAVEIPVDLQYRKADVEVPAVPAEWPRVSPDAAMLDAAASALSDAERPLIWAGGGVLISGAWDALRELAERVGAPVVTSIEGRGSIPEDHALALGQATTSRRGGEMIAEADVLLAVGTRFSMNATRQWTTSIQGRLIHLDADPAVIGRNYAAEIAVVGDALLGLQGVLARCEGSKSSEEWRAKATSARAETVASGRALIGEDHAALMDAMRAALPRDANIVRDATVPAYMWGDRLIPVLSPRTSLRPASAAIGPGLPLAIGAALGNGKPTALIQGDGGFMLSIGELATLAELALPVVVCVFNDSGYGVLRAIQMRTFEGRTAGVDLHTPDFILLAQSMGIPAERVDSVDGFAKAFGDAIGSGAPALIDIDMRALPLGFNRP